MAITSVFQVDDAGSIPADRSKLAFLTCEEGITRSDQKMHSHEFCDDGLDSCAVFSSSQCSAEW